MDELNLYGFVENNSVSGFDAVGLWKNLGGSGHYSYSHYAAEPGDTLERLARYVGGVDDDWQCLWPVRVEKPTEYPRVSPCDIYDVDNVWSSVGSSLKLEVAGGSQRSIPVSHAPGFEQVTAAEVFGRIRDVSGKGRTPISLLYFHGHGGSGDFGLPQIAGLAGEHDARPMEQGIEGYNRANAKEGPLRCWFTASAEVRFFGCNSDYRASDFASRVLRRTERHRKAYSIGTIYDTAWHGGAEITRITESANSTPEYRLEDHRVYADWREAPIWGSEYYGGL